MHLLNIVASPRKEKSRPPLSWTLSSPNRESVRGTFRLIGWICGQGTSVDAEAINTKYKGVSGKSMTPVDGNMGKDQGVGRTLPTGRPHRIGVPMWNFSVPYKLKQLIDLSCQRNMLFSLDGEFYGP